MDFDTVCREFFTLPPATFIAHVKNFLLAAYDSLENTAHPILHPSEIAPGIAIINAFEAQALAHPELYDNWLLFAIFNCRDCPREFLLPAAQSVEAMTPLTQSLLPAGTSIRAPHLARFKEQITAYVQTLPAIANEQSS